MSHFADVAHQPLRRCVDWVEDHELRNSRTSYCCQTCRSQSSVIQVPAPKTLAVLDSLLYTVADEFVPAAAFATFATASEGDGVMVGSRAEDANQRTPR
jgi:hypothetical protein